MAAVVVEAVGAAGRQVDQLPRGPADMLPMRDGEHGQR